MENKINLFDSNNVQSIYFIPETFYYGLKSLNKQLIKIIFDFMRYYYNKNDNMESYHIQELNRKQIMLLFNSIDIEDFLGQSFDKRMITKVYQLMIMSYEPIFGNTIEYENDNFVNIQKYLVFSMKNYQSLISTQINSFERETEYFDEDVPPQFQDPLPFDFITGMEQYENLFLLIDNLIFSIFDKTHNLELSSLNDNEFDEIFEYQFTNQGFLLQIDHRMKTTKRKLKKLDRNKEIGRYNKTKNGRGVK